MSLDVMKQALAVLEEIADEVFSPYDNKLGDAITALRAAIEQAQKPVAWFTVNEINEWAAKYLEKHPEQEPVAWVGPSWLNPETRTWESESFAPRPIKGWIPLYTAPRQWQGLTDEERIEFRRLGLVGVEIVEAKLKEKNT